MSTRQDEELLRLAQMNGRIADGRERVRRQQNLLQRFKGSDRDRALAKKVLLELEETLIQWEKARDLILWTLDNLKR